MSARTIEQQIYSVQNRINTLNLELADLRIEAITRLHYLIDTHRFDEFLTLYNEVIRIPNPTPKSSTNEIDKPNHKSEQLKPPKPKRIRKTRKSPQIKELPEAPTDTAHQLTNHKPTPDEINKNRMWLNFNPTVSSFLHDPFIYQALVNSSGQTVCYTTEEFIHLLLDNPDKNTNPKISNSDILQHAMEVLQTANQSVKGYLHPGQELMLYTEEEVFSILAALPQNFIRDQEVSNEEIDDVRIKVQNKLKIN